MAKTEAILKIDPESELRFKGNFFHLSLCSSLCVVTKVWERKFSLF